MSSYPNDIKSFDPFIAEFDSYDGSRVRVQFTCPHCGGHSVKRTKGREFDRHFFQGSFRCLTCCKGSYLGEPFNYYSIAFIKVRSKICNQLTLF